MLVDAGLTQTLEEAIKASHDLQAAIRAVDKGMIVLAASRFNAPVKVMGLTQWTVGERKIGNPSTLLDRLQVLDTILLQTSAGMASIDTAPSDDQVVACASGGAALFGHCVGFSGPESIEMAVLQPPTTCKLQAPTCSTDIADAWFENAFEAAQFRKAMSVHGRTAVSGAREHDVKSLPASGASIACSTYAYVPMKSFFLDAPAMELAEKALADASDLTTVEAAKYFLCDYGSHVLCGVFHVGGVFSKTVEVEATADVDISTLVSACADPTARDLSINYSSFAYGSNIDTRQSTLSDDKRTPCEITTSIESTGPDAASYTIFQQRLLADRSTWHLIDRPTTRVGVWDLLDAAGLETAANLVRSAWLELVASSRVSTPDVAAAVRSVYVAMWQRNPAFGSDTKDQNIASADEATLAVQQQLRVVAQADGRALVDVTLLALRSDAAFGLTLTADCFRDECLLVASRRLVATDVAVAMLQLGTMYMHVLYAVLAQESVNLDPTLHEALQRAAQLAALEHEANKLTDPSVGGTCRAWTSATCHGA
ncbi:hypothetical protein SPRG_10413 [Saprolegnia parasitica CBS 223.65]|uniref:MACPF domain-containing protein n=1 Tax=Saprolegnia parasitica (strain CBS 223.65) TaxID=695850 RepID=A0A067CCS2_SAPPC|nr:hypothetical protein SPRG_10413 [Saprolegnia parasitica CBS 223.65]KDO24336.1 hypothetical protein SPRG_10413 [Saprolegnia parasitica CBS 223.65]|eukprot:XP_012204931.1 hypothetical protein SPRG_10413 [Saprolegnia parasitica CBS 223.65]